eukprot:CAMPEP_0172649330 /NCGR_PEP_ID=MMETSP1068-20121228/241732_1 /TAXON_ID=35684 /ORGANISM="Pseudopedinella elastica, Strain CCMP716" /LENGTH=213 /DNA_ID=CAMNT_0013463679 /DNA_START=347 /DNA_END=985 /DNA_ORIENTATION=-
MKRVRRHGGGAFPAWREATPPKAPCSRSTGWAYHLRNMISLLSGSTWAQQLCKAEKALLESADLSGVSCTTADTPITFKGQAQSIHSVYMACDHTVSTVHPEAPMVLMHGFGQGAASWWRCLPGLARGHASQGPVFALDWLGVGLSSRPDWTPGECPKAAEEWFVESLEKWRKKQGIERMHLVAHSLSAFGAVGYAEKYPERLETLVLASPAG